MDEENSILNSVKIDCGITAEYTYFDQTLIRYINLVFLTLWQLGVGPDSPYSINDEYDLWSSFSENANIIGMVKPYISMKVRLMFDPPTSSFVLDALKKQTEEYEWRLNVSAETPSFNV